MIIGNIINDSFGLLSKQLRFYCWHFRRNLDQRQCQELIDLLQEQHFERLANKIKTLNQSNIADCKQQVGKLLFEHCLARNRRNQLVQLIESKLVDINVRLDNYGRTLLHRSAYNLDVELVRILIEHGVNIRLRDYAGNTALHIAIQSYRNGAVIYGNESDVVQNLTLIIRLLLEADKNLLNERSKRKRIKLLTEINDSKSEQQLDANNNNSQVGRAQTIINRIGSSQTPLNSSIFSFPQRGKEAESAKRSTAANLLVGGEFKSQVPDFSKYPSGEGKELDSFSKQRPEFQAKTINPILLEDATSPLVDTKNAFGRTALHYCVLVVGERHLAHFVQLLVSFGADTDAVDSRMKTPLYCLVKRPGISAIRQKCLAIAHLLNTGCDDLGLAIDPKTYFTDELIKNLERNISIILQSKSESSVEPIFTNRTFKRVPSLKHLSRLRLIRLRDEKTRLKRQTKLFLPQTSPSSLNFYVNRRILDQSELF